MRPDKLFLADIIVACAEVEEFLEGVSQETFTASKIIRSAVLQKLIVIGEAASRVSREVQTAHADVPWADMRAFRNFAVHAYFSVDWRIVWITATVDVPSLHVEIKKIIDALPEEADERESKQPPDDESEGSETT